jgi:hypothetical protein
MVLENFINLIQKNKKKKKVCMYVYTKNKKESYIVFKNCIFVCVYK